MEYVAPPIERGIAYYSDFARFEEFCRDCLVIIDKSNRRTPFLLNTTQRRILAEIRRLRALGIPPRLLVLKARQVGVSTLTEAMLFWACLTKENRSALIISHTQKLSKLLFRMSRNMHRYLPKWMQQATRISNVHEIEFDSGSKMQIEVQGDPRGYAAQDIHLSEFAFYEQAEATLTAIMQSVPRITDSLAVIESTANGVGNKFHKMWQRATGLAIDTQVDEDEKGWTPLFFPWFEHDEYAMPCPEKMLLTSEERVLMEQHPQITREKLKWRRWCINANLDGDEEKFAQEYPACVVAGTRVGTARGIIPVEEVRETDAATLGIVAHLHRQPESDIWHARTSLGYSLSGTWHHPVFSAGGVLVPLSTLKPGTRIKLQPPRFAARPHVVSWRSLGTDCSITSTPDLCRFLGLFAGDGSYSGGTLSIVCDGKDADVVAESQRLLSTLFGLNATTRSVGNKKGGTEVRVGCTGIAPAFERLGIVHRRADGSWTRSVAVPEIVWRSPRSHVREFLRGLFEADGFVSGTGYVKLFSRSEQFLRDVQLLLLGFGITSRTCSANKKSSDGHEYQGNEMCLRRAESKMFLAEIGFISSRKSARARPIKPSGRPAAKLELTDSIARVWQEGRAATYDLTVEDGGAFDAGGILTHNTAEEAFALSGRPAFDTRAVLHYTNELAKIIAAGELPKKMEIESDPPGIGVPNIIVYDRGRLRIFFDREDRHTYIVGADPSEGDPGSDHSPLAVLDQQTMDLAATWFGKAPPDVLACTAIDLARYFNEGMVAHEANNHGILFGETVIQLGYPNLYYRKVAEDSVSGAITEKPGYLSTTRNREYLFNTERKYVRMRMGRIRCPHFVQQMQSLIYVDDKVQAGVGMEKDLLSAFGVALMAHRGTMNVPLEPLPIDFVNEALTTAQLLKEREGPEGAREFIMVRTGMTQDQVDAVREAEYERVARQRKYGLGGMR